MILARCMYCLYVPQKATPPMGFIGANGTLLLLAPVQVFNIDVLVQLGNGALSLATNVALVVSDVIVHSSHMSSQGTHQQSLSTEVAGRCFDLMGLLHRV